MTTAIMTTMHRKDRINMLLKWANAGFDIIGGSRFSEEEDHDDDDEDEDHGDEDEDHDDEDEGHELSTEEHEEEEIIAASAEGSQYLYRIGIMYLC